MRRVVASFAIAFTFGLVGATSAIACSCAAIAPETRFQLSDASVIVRLVEVVPQSEQVARFRYRVTEVLKGNNGIGEGQRLSLRSAMSSAACGLPRREGHRYGLFLRRARDHWSATLCDVTTPRGMREAAGDGRASSAGPSCSR